MTPDKERATKHTTHTARAPGHTNTRRKGLRGLINVEHAVRHFTCGRFKLTTHDISLCHGEERERGEKQKKNTQCRVKAPLSFYYTAAYFGFKQKLKSLSPLFSNEYDLMGQKGKVTNPKLFMCPINMLVVAMETCRG